MAIKTILVPTDFSKNANNAFNYAIEIAKKSKAKIILLHAYDLSFSSPDIPYQYVVEQAAAVETIAKKKLNTLCGKLKSSRTVSCEYINREALAVDLILAAIKDRKVDLVVMGTQGASGLKEVFWGSTTGRVIGKATCPVIAVPEKAKFTGFKNITFSSDYHASDIVVLKKLIELSKIFKSKIKVIHVSDVELTNDAGKLLMSKFRDKVVKRLAFKGISYEIIFGSDTEKALEDYLKLKTTNILAVSTRHRSLIERVFGTSITKKLSYHTKTPLLVFHFKADKVVFI